VTVTVESGEGCASADRIDAVLVLRDRAERLDARERDRAVKQAQDAGVRSARSCDARDVPAGSVAPKSAMAAGLVVEADRATQDEHRGE
jgi:hypothetical protein